MKKIEEKLLKLQEYFKTFDIEIIASFEKDWDTRIEIELYINSEVSSQRVKKLLLKQEILPVGSEIYMFRKYYNVTTFEYMLPI
jgi:hypothetical protein